MSFGLCKTIRSPGVAARALAVVGLAAMLPACTASGPRGSAAQRMTQDTVFSAYEDSGPRRPLLSLPNSGPVIAVQESRVSGGIRQHIAYSGSGGSERAELAVTPSGGIGDPTLGKPTRIGIATELASLTPDGPYRVLTQSISNAYGPLGVAVGTRCAYAWQWIRDVRGVEFGGNVPSNGRLTVSLRVQHCRRGPTRSEALLADLVRLRLGAGAPVAVARRVRRVRPVAVAVAPPAEPEVLAPAIPVVSAARSPQVTVNGSRTLVSSPPEPSPQAQRSDPRYLGPQAAPQRLPETAAVPRPSAAGSRPLDQPRYLTDLAAPTGPARAQEPSGVAAPRPVPRAEPLSPDLPTQAYRGPTPPPFGW